MFLYPFLLRFQIVYKTVIFLKYRFITFSGNAYAEGNAAAIRYVMMVIANYFTGFIDDRTLIILVGNHQPKFPITEQGAPLSVPIHITSRDYSLIEQLTNYGYTFGLIPEQKPRIREWKHFSTLYWK